MKPTIKRKTKMLYAILLLFLIGCGGFAYAAATGPRVFYEGMDHTEKPLRLHILAESDSVYDQQLKIQVRDTVISLLQDTLSQAASKEEAMRALEARLPEIKACCNQYLAGKAEYQATVSLVVDAFPSIDYDGVVFAAGEYDALRIVLGEGAGHNWWCVLFPPLCFVDLAEVPDEEATVSVLAGDSKTQTASYRLDWRIKTWFAD